MAALTRRTLLQRLPLFGASTALAVAVPAAAVAGELPSSATAKERFDHHLREMQRAAEELDPMIARWGMEDEGQRLLICAVKIQGRYVGDGIYLHKTHVGLQEYVRIDLAPEIIDGERTFIVRSWPSMIRRARMTEPRLEEYIGRLMRPLRPSEYGAQT